MNATSKIETRRTDWLSLDGGRIVYRIWQQFDGLRWFQRHEWRNADGTTCMDEWIRGGSQWTPGATTLAA